MGLGIFVVCDDVEVIKSDYFAWPKESSELHFFFAADEEVVHILFLEYKLEFYFFEVFAVFVVWDL